MPRLIQPYNPNEQHQHPLLFDNAVPIRNVPEYNVGMGTYTRASQMRDAVLRFSSSPQLQTNEAEATRYIAMILASTQMPVYKVTVNNQTRRIVLNRDFNNLFNQLLEDPAVQVMAHDFATNREYRENMLNQNGVFSRDHFLQSLVTGYRTFDDPQAAQENNQPQNANIEVNPNNQQNVQANQENIQNQNQNAELDDDDEPFHFVENFDEVERQRQQNQQQNRQPNRPQINIGQPARDIEGPHIDLDAIYRGLGPRNPAPLNPEEDFVFEEQVPLEQANANRPIRRRNRLNIVEEAPEDNNQPVNNNQPENNNQQPRNNGPQVNVARPVNPDDLQGPRFNPNPPEILPPNPQYGDPEDEFVFEERVPLEQANGNRQARRRNRLNIVEEAPEENNQPVNNSQQPNLRNDWVVGDENNERVGNLDDLLNQPLPNPQNQAEEEEEEYEGDREVGNYRIGFDEQGRPIVEQREPLMDPYDPNEVHNPPRVFDNNIPNPLPYYNGQNPFPTVQAFHQIRNFPGNPQNVFANEENVRNHIAGLLALSEMPLYRLQTEQGDVPVVNENDFNQRYARFQRDPAVRQMAQRFVTDPQYRQVLLGGQNANADTFIKNTVADYRDRVIQRQQNREGEQLFANRNARQRNPQNLQNQQNQPNQQNLQNQQNPPRQNQGPQVNNPGFWNIQNPQQNQPNLQNQQNQQPNPQQNLQQPNPNPQVQEMDINQLNAMFVDPNMDLEGNVLDNEDNPILNQDINQNIQPNQNLQNQNPQFNQNIQQQNVQQNLQQNIQQPGPQQNQPNPLPNQNQNQNQQILPDGNGAITYRQYMDMVAESIQGDAEAAVRDNVVANMLAAQMLIGDNPNRPVDWTMLRQVSERFSRQESFKEMLRDRPQDVRHAMMQNDAVALVGLLAQAETARNQRLEVYRRPQDRVQDDSALLQNALDSVKKKSGKSKSPAKAEKRNPLYQQMINKWAHLRRVTESGTQPTGFQVKELIDVTQRYINGGSNIAGGNQPDLRPAAFKEAMCVLKRYMPEEEFNAYCTNINLAQHVDVVEPSAFLPGRLTGYAVTGEELMNETRKALKKNQTPELYATVMAIHNLTKGRIGLIVNPADVEKEAQRLLKPGSGLNRTLQDPQSRARLDALAKDGSAKNLAQTLESHTLDHVARTASGQFKLAQRMLTSGPLNRYFASKSLSMLLAAHRAASHSDAGTIINNRGFREKAEEIERDPKFQNLLDQYMNDLEFRNRINRELSNPNATAMELELQLERQQRNLRINRNPVREAQERHYDPRNMRPHRAMALDNGVGANGLPEFRGQNYSLSDPMVRQVHSFAGQPAANEQEALRIFAGALALSKSPVFRISENGRQEKVVDTDQFNQLFNNYRNDPAVQRMARDFAANPQYRERILHGNNERTPEGMITNISKELIALKRQEAQANRQQNQQVPQNQQINPNLQNQQINPNRQAPQDQQIPVNQNGQPNLQQNRQNIRQRREEMALQNPYL